MIETFRKFHRPNSLKLMSPEINAFREIIPKFPISCYSFHGHGDLGSVSQNFLNLRTPK